jgi:lipid-binding SYLF domain-containing protein
MKALLCLILVCAPTTGFVAQSSRIQTALTRVDKAAALMKSFSDLGSDSVPLELMKKAKAIAVVPEMGQKSTFLARTSDGRGIFVRRNDDGTWGFPTYVRCVAVRTEFTPTLFWTNSKIDIVFLFMDERGFDLIHGYWKDPAKVIHEKLALGPVIRGKGADVTTDNAWVLYYTFEDGKLSGEEFHNNKFASTTALRHDDDNNRAVYKMSFKEMQKNGVPGNALPTEIIGLQKFMNDTFKVVK